MVVALANRTALSRVSANGGTPRPLTTLNVEQENSHRWPQLLPDGSTSCLPFAAIDRKTSIKIGSPIRPRCGR